MSGTSADGIDAVVAEISGSGVTLRARVAAHFHEPFASELHEQILAASLRGNVGELCELNFFLGEAFARAALAVIRQAGLRPRDIEVIGSHGQTVHHLPSARTPSTLQIAEPAVIAERTGITTIADFRVADVAAGGQGAPLTPYADWVLFRDKTHPRIIQNIGGIGNLTFLPRRARLKDVLAFDTGPGNMVIDGLVNVITRGRKKFDRDGRMGARGKISGKLLQQLLRHGYLKRSPPKTTGREEFGETFLQLVRASARPLRLSSGDLVATATAFTASSIVEAYKRFVFPRLSARELARTQIVLGGGGAKNPELRRLLREQLPDVEWLTHEDFGLANEAKEALAFAILAHESYLGVPANVPSATGARHPVRLGKFVPGR